MGVRRGLGFGGFLALTALVLLVVAAAGVLPFRRLLAQERAVDLAETQLNALLEENMRLGLQLAALGTDEEVERLAREHFGLVMPGEVGYVAVVPDDIIDPLPPEPLSTLRREDPWWNQFWDFLTGRDIVSDG